MKIQAHDPPPPIYAPLSLSHICLFYQEPPQRRLRTPHDLIRPPLSPWTAASTSSSLSSLEVQCKCTTTAPTPVTGSHLLQRATIAVMAVGTWTAKSERRAVHDGHQGPWRGRGSQCPSNHFTGSLTTSSVATLSTIVSQPVPTAKYSRYISLVSSTYS